MSDHPFVMRILLSVVLMLLILSGCKAPQYSVGMSEQDFKKKNKGVEVVYQTSDETVYKKVNYPFGKQAVAMFFYFANGVLVRFDRDRRSPDIIIEKREG